MRFRPGDTIQASFTLQYDVKFDYVRNLDLSAGFNYPRFGFDAGWSRANRQPTENPESRTPSGTPSAPRRASTCCRGGW